jgi:Flp pilus assembly protein TadG
MATRIRQVRHGDRGAAAVEFAIIVPLLITLVFGIINFGAWFGQQLALNQAVREGARAAVVAGTGRTADVPTLVQNATTGIAMDPSAVVVSTNRCPGTGGGQSLTVTARYESQALAPLPLPGFDAVTLRAKAVFRCEW